MFVDLIGKPVLYILADGQKRPATVTNYWGGDVANLTVHLDGSNDLVPARIDEPYTDGVNNDKEMRVNKPNPIAGSCKPGLIPQGAFSPPHSYSLFVGSARHDIEGAPGTWQFLV